MKLRHPVHLASVSGIALVGALSAAGASAQQLDASESFTDGRFDNGILDSVGTGGPGLGCAAVFNDKGNQVLSTVNASGGGGFSYAYRVCNNDAIVGTGPEWIHDWAIPWFWDGDGDPLLDSEMGVSEIFVPEGWFVEVAQRGEENANEESGWDGVIEWQDEDNFWNDYFDNIFCPNDPDSCTGLSSNNPYDNHEYVLHFYTCEGGEGGIDCFIPEGFEEGTFDFTNDNPVPPPGPLADPDNFGPNSRGGFGLLSELGTTAAPHQVSWVEDVDSEGDDPTTSFVRTRFRDGDFVGNFTGDPDLPDDDGDGNPDGLLGGGLLAPTVQRAFDNIDRDPTIPEPGSLALLGAGLAAAGAARRRRKKDDEG